MGPQPRRYEDTEPESEDNQPEPKVTHHEDGSRAETCTFLDPDTGQRAKWTIEYYNSDGSLKHKNVDVFDINTGQITQETREVYSSNGAVRNRTVQEYDSPNTAIKPK